MTDRSTGELEWRWHECDGGACVQVAATGDLVMMRSNVDPGVIFRMTRDEWQDFVAGVKQGDFDGL